MELLLLKGHGIFFFPIAPSDKLTQRIICTTLLKNMEEKNVSIKKATFCEDKLK